MKYFYRFNNPVAATPSSRVFQPIVSTEYTLTLEGTVTIHPSSMKRKDWLHQMHC